MSSSSEKPRRKVLRVRHDTTAEAAPPARQPLRGRHLPLRDRRARRGETLAGQTEATTGPAQRQTKDRPQPPASRPARKGGPSHAPARQAGLERLEVFFAPCPRGLEPELAKELAELGATEIQPGSGGVQFSGTPLLAWKVNLWSRLAIRVLRRVAHGRYRGEQDLYEAARALPWPQWFALERTIAVRTVAHQSPLKSLNFAALKIKDAICDRFRDDTGRRPDVDARAPDVPVLLYLDNDRFTLYLDLTGEPLNRRGYRVRAAAAPLNENLAAGLLRLSGWNPDTPLLDPMMGGGTILLEAALMALNIAPGLARHFAFENLLDFDRVAWARLRKDAQAVRRPARPLPIFGCDLDPEMLAATEANLRAAGVLECVSLRQADATEVAAPQRWGVLVSNPPYGVRLRQTDAAAFYRALGDNLKRHFAGWTAYLLSADPDLPKAIGLKASRRTPLFNGPLECRLYEYRLIAGPMRRRPPS